MRLFAVGSISLVILAGCSDRVETARVQVKRWVEKLDGRTTETGSYQRFAGERLPEADPWGSNLYVQYEQGGMAEVVKVRSAGPDGEPFSADDIVEQRMAANLAGVGQGIATSAGKVAGDMARETANGTIEGIKEGWERGRSATGKRTIGVRNNPRRSRI